MLSQFLKKQRLNINCTQKEMAEKIGISECYYIQIERGHRKPGISVINKIAEALNMKPSQIRSML